MEYLVRRPKYVEQAREEALRKPQHVDHGARNVQDASEDPVVEVQMWQVAIAHEDALVNEWDCREKS